MGYHPDGSSMHGMCITPIQYCIAILSANVSIQWALEWRDITVEN